MNKFPWTTILYMCIKKIDGTALNDFMLYTLKYITNEDLQVVSQTTVLKFYVTKIFCV